MRCVPRLENHPLSPSMGLILTLISYIAMTFRRRVVMLSRSRKFGRYPEARCANCAFGTIQASIALIVLLSLLHPSRAFAANPDLATVLTGSRQRIQQLDYRVTGRLTRVEVDGKRTSYKFAAKAHWFPDGLRRRWRQSSKASPGPRFLSSKGVRERQILDARTLISASPALKERKRNKSNRLEHPRCSPSWGEFLFWRCRDPM